MGGLGPMTFIAPVLIYAVFLAVLAVLLYLVIRFGIRDGLRSHARWLERRGAPSQDGD